MNLEDAQECLPCSDQSTQCPANIMNTTICADAILEEEPFISQFDLTPFVQVEDAVIDWSTLSIDNVDVATVNYLRQEVFPGCIDNENENINYGTHISYFPGNFSTDLCGPGVQTTPGHHDYLGCNTVASDPGSPNGNFYSTDWIHLGDGILQLDVNLSSGFLPFSASFRINFTVQDVNGCSYEKVAYFHYQLPL